MNLLGDIDREGAPRDYLFARIRCRRAALDISGRGRWAGSADPRQALRAEHAWVYAQLDRRLRRSLLPFFEYHELRNLVIALRYLAAGDPEAVKTQLKFSLLHPQLRKILLAAEKATQLVSRLEQLLADRYPFFGGLTEQYLRQGPGGLEQRLLGGYLQRAAANSRCRPLQVLLGYLLEMRNLLALYKHLHWQVPSPPPLLAEGEPEHALYKRIWAKRDMSSLVRLMQKTAGLDSDPETIGVEDFLYQGLTTRLRREGQDPLQAGLIIDYLWRCHLTARNRGLRLVETGGLQEPPPTEARR